MTFMFQQGQTLVPDPFLTPAPAPFSSQEDRDDAAFDRAEIDANRGSIARPGVGMLEEREMAWIGRIADQMGPDPEAPPPNLPDTGYIREMPSEVMARMMAERNRYLARQNPEILLKRARAAAEADPEAWKDTPLTLEAIRAQVGIELAAERAEAEATLRMAPDDAFLTETWGEIRSDFLTEENAAAAVAGIFFPPGRALSAIGARIGGEAALGGGVEAAELPDRFAVAERLGTEAPDPLTRIGLGALFGGAVGAGFEAVRWSVGLMIDPVERGRAYDAFRARLPARIGGTDDAATAAARMDSAEAAIVAGEPVPVTGQTVVPVLPDRAATLRAIETVESRGNPEAVSPDGAIGPMQVLPATAREPGYGADSIFEIARRMGRAVDEETDEAAAALLRDPDINRAFGAGYWDALTGRFGRFEDALVAYNAGPGAALDWIASGRQPQALFKETRDYIRKVKSALDRDGIVARVAADPEGADRALILPGAGGAHGVRFEVVELDSLVPSHLDGQVNPAFPPELQPRDRGRAASDAQIAEIASNLDPRLISRDAGIGPDGAPVAGPDGVVEIGNGRVAALARVYADMPDREAAYRAMLEADGFDIAGMRQPVLIRRRFADLDPEDRAALARAGNERASASLSAAERAAVDAAGIKPETLALYRGGEVGSAENAAFRKAAIAAIPETERATMLDRDGGLSGAGAARIESAVLARAFPDPAFLGAALEATDDGVRSIVAALRDTAPQIAALRGQIEAGAVPPGMDVSADIAAAALAVRDAARKGTSLEDAVGQADALGGGITPLQEGFIRLFAAEGGFGRRASAQAIAARLDDFVAEARKVSPEAGLFGDLPPLSPGEVLAGALDRAGAARREAGKGWAGDGFADQLRNLPDAPPRAPAPEATPEPEPAASAAETPAEAASPDPAPATQPRGGDAALAWENAAANRMEADLIEAMRADPALAARDIGDGTTVREALDEIEADETLRAVLDACTIGKRP